MTKKEAQRESIIQDRICMSDDDECGRSYYYDRGRLKHVVCLILSREQLLDHEQDIWKPLSVYEDRE